MNSPNSTPPMNRPENSPARSPCLSEIDAGLVVLVIKVGLISAVVTEHHVHVSFSNS